jgi:hypothetical protein
MADYCGVGKLPFGDLEEEFGDTLVGPPFENPLPV